MAEERLQDEAPRLCVVGLDVGKAPLQDLTMERHVREAGNGVRRISVGQHLEERASHLLEFLGIRLYVLAIAQPPRARRDRFVHAVDADQAQPARS